MTSRPTSPGQQPGRKEAVETSDYQRAQMISSFRHNCGLNWIGLAIKNVPYQFLHASQNTTSKVGRRRGLSRHSGHQRIMGSLEEPS